MAVGVAAPHLGAHAEEAAVLALDHLLAGDGPREARPARPAVVLVARAEERLAAHHVDVDALALLVPELVPEGRLGRVLLRHVVLERRQPAPQLGVAGFGGPGRVLGRRRARCGLPVGAPDVVEKPITARVVAIEPVPDRILLVIVLMVLL